MQLPQIDTLADYAAVRGERGRWDPLVDTICARHRLPSGPRRYVEEGSSIVVAVGDDLFIKLAPPLFAADIEADVDFLPVVAGRLPVTVPELVTHGRLGDWPYAVVTRVAGQPIGEVWEGLSAAERHQLIAQVGELIASLRGIELPAGRADPAGWDRLLKHQVATCPARHASHGVDPSIVAALPAYLAAALPDAGAHAPVGFVHADLTREHLFVRLAGPRGPRLTALIDFGDAMLAATDYEFVAPAIELARGDPSLLRTLWIEAGEPAAALTGDWSARMMAWTLLHRYARLRDCTDWLPGQLHCRTLPGIASRLWPVVQSPGGSQPFITPNPT